jgi:hypothetical protein
MPIWRLEPVNLESEHWATSMHKDAVVVRAANEDRARRTATKAFIIAATIPLSRRTLFSPWEQPELVRCSRLEGITFAECGPEAVLDPPHYE